MIEESDLYFWEGVRRKVKWDNNYVSFNVRIPVSLLFDCLGIAKYDNKGKHYVDAYFIAEFLLEQAIMTYDMKREERHISLAAWNAYNYARKTGRSSGCAARTAFATANGAARHYLQYTNTEKHQ